MESNQELEKRKQENAQSHFQDSDFRIKTLEELNQNMSIYEGMVTRFREDGVIPEPMASVEDLEKYHEKTPVYYGRSGEKYGGEVVLTKEAYRSGEVTIDTKAYFPKEEKKTSNYQNFPKKKEEKADTEFVSTTDNYSSNGLNTEYLDSFLTQEPQSLSLHTSKDTVIDNTEKKFPPETPDPVKKTRITRADLINRQLAEQNASNHSDRMISNRLQLAQQEASKKEETKILKEKESLTFTKIVKELFTYSICILIAMVLSLLIVKFVAQKTEVIGDSMNPNLYNHQQLVMDKISYRFHDPQRFDVVVFPEDANSNYVKRIIGLPGETVSIQEGYIYINGQLLSDDVYGNATIAKDHYYRLEEPVTLNSDEYFVMGDNRNNSKDSRDSEVGNVKKERITGKVIFRIWPLKSIGKVE